MNKLTNAQLRQKEERVIMKNGVSPVFFACPELDVSEHHDRAIRSFLYSSTCKGKQAKVTSYQEVISKDLYPEHHSKMTLIFVGGRIFLVHTEGTCLTHKLQDEMPDFEDEDIKVVPPRTIIIDISGDLSGQEISASVRAHELAHAVFPRSVYHIEVCISSRNQYQTIRVSMNLYQLGEKETGSDGSVRKNIFIDRTRIVKSDGIVFLAELLDDDTTMDRVELGEEEEKVVGSICFDAVLQSTNMEEVD